MAEQLSLNVIDMIFNYEKKSFGGGAYEQTKNSK